MVFDKERYLNRGLKSIPGKYVCYHCFDDYVLKEFIRSHAASTVCSFCGKRGSKPIAAEIDDVVNLIHEGICYEYEDAAEHVGYESSEGGYLLPTMVTIELIEKIFEDEELNAELMEDLMDVLPDAAWVHINPYESPEGERMIIDWKTFCRQVKHETRYMFFKLSTQDKDQFPGVGSEPFEILFQLGKIVQDIGMVRNVPVGYRIFRVRCHNFAEDLQSVNELGPPPVELAKYSSRMSPAGIPMFYGALDLCTAVMETYRPEEHAPCIITKARFETLKPLRILDLTALPEYPSLFDENRRWLRPAFEFIHAFIRDAAKPIDRDGKEHVEYVPTQVVAEYFRRVYRDENGNAVNGIIYPSSQKIGGISCVLFCESKNCCDEDARISSNKDLWLVMKRSSVKRVEPKFYTRL